jgi:glycolate oxidase FAD binding subunit
MTTTNLDTTVRAATSIWGADHVRPGDTADAVAGHQPKAVLEPPDADTAASMLRWADTEHLSIVPRGAGTKLTWGAAPASVDLVLSTRRLVAGLDHCAGDLTAIVPAGWSLAQVNEVLGRERQWLPLDPALADRATIGGIVAANDSGPRRHRHGTARDLIIGVEMALVDGRTAKAGGRVVKNVAGYDLSRLLCGSFGTLALITSATFKLAPLPAASRTVVASMDGGAQLGQLALALAAGPLTPSAVELDAPPVRLMIRFETTPVAADKQAAAACELCAQHRASTTVLQDASEDEAWLSYERHLWRTDGTLLKIALLPSDVGEMVDLVQRAAASRAVDYRLGGRAGLGVLILRLQGQDAAHMEIAREVRQAAVSHGGSVVLISTSVPLERRIEPWGDVGSALRMMQAVKARFDPHNTLNPGRGPGGI